jgi:hypothetical protein
MKSVHAGLLLLLVAVVGTVSFRLTVRAQDRPGAPLPEAAAGAISVQDALQRPFSFPFATPTSLADVCQYLRQTLRAPVVLDRAALDRLELKPEDPVQLQLDGVRLKTGLKLLLDQVGLTFQVVPEDNLLILTDTHGSSDPFDRVVSELKALHHDVHDLQDTVDDISWSLGVEGEGGAKMRKPTIIEEVPGESKPGEKTEPAPKGAEDRPRTRRGSWRGR